MGQTANQIENHIEDAREHLSSNLRELENKVRSATDWRQQFERRPLIFLGIALGGGVLVATALGRRNSGPRHVHHYAPPAPPQSASQPTPLHIPSALAPTIDRASKVWDTFSGALVGIAAARVKDYVDRVLPGFAEQYSRAESGQR